MKIALLSVGVLIFGLILLLAWCGYPWSLNERIVKPEIVHVEPEGMVNNEEFGQLFISDTHPERTENIVKTTHQSYKIFNL